MSALNIDQALISTVMAGGLALDIVHENGSYSTWGGAAYTNSDGVYSPDANREHMEIRNFPAGIAPYSLKHTDEHVGLFQAIIKYPADTGGIEIKTKADAFLALFTLGDAITYSGQNAYPTAKNRDGGRIEGGFYQIVCRVNYRAFVAR